MLASIASLALAAAGPGDAIAASFRGLRTEIEDDSGGADSAVRSVTTTGCASTIVGAGRGWRVDWRTVETVALVENFIHLRGPGLQIAVVAEIEDAAGLAKLRAMRDAMVALGERCRPR